MNKKQITLSIALAMILVGLAISYGETRYDSKREAILFILFVVVIIYSIFIIIFKSRIGHDDFKNSSESLSYFLNLKEKGGMTPEEYEAVKQRIIKSLGVKKLK